MLLTFKTEEKEITLEMDDSLKVEYALGVIAKNNLLDLPKKRSLKTVVDQKDNSFINESRTFKDQAIKDKEVIMILGEE